MLLKHIFMNQETKELFRSRDHRILFGVCGGLGEYFDINPIIFRLGFLILLLVSSIGALLYMVLFFVVPEYRSSEDQMKERCKNDEINESIKKVKQWIEKNRNILAVFLIIFGFYFLISPSISFGLIDIHVLFSLALIVVALFILFKRS